MNKNRFIATFCMFLIVMLPVCMADEFEQEGESLIIEAKQYEPEVLRSDYMEQLNIPVRVILGAIRGEPISLPEIKDVSVKVIKRKDAEKKNASVEGTSDKILKDYVQGTSKFYKAPYPTLDNLGYVQITLKKIEKETEVPKQIDIDFEATISYEAEITGLTIGGDNVKTLKQATIEMVQDNKEEHSLLGGRYYLRVVSIRPEEASVEVLDSEFKRGPTRTLKLGEVSTSISLTRDEKEVQPQSIRLKLEEVRGAGAVKLEFETGKGDIISKEFEKNQEIMGGWKVDTCYTGNNEQTNDDYVIFKHKDFKSDVVMLVNQEGYDEIADLKKLIDECPEEKCKLYEKTGITNLQKYEVKTQRFREALSDLETTGLKKLVSIECTKTGSVAKIEVGGVESSYRSSNKLTDCGCTVGSISRDSITITGLQKCDPSERSNSKTFKVGDADNICRTTIKLAEITSDQEVVISVLPGTGKGKTTTYFSVHIPVEKRLIQYTPEELQQKINKTEELIKKLDNTINSLQKLVEGWTKICLATMAVFTVMAFFEGTSGTKPTEGAKTGTGEEGAQAKEKPLKLPTLEGNLKIQMKNLEDGATKALDPNYKYSVREGVIYQNEKAIGLTSFKFTESSQKKTYLLKEEETEWVLVENKDKQYGNFRSGDISEISISSDGDSIAIPLKSCSQLPDYPIEAQNTHKKRCDRYKANLGTDKTALYLIYYEKGDYFEVWWAGQDGRLSILQKGEQDGDIMLDSFKGTDAGIQTLKKNALDTKNSIQRKEKKVRFQGHEYDSLRTHLSDKKDGVACGKVLGPEKCKILFNACDPVMCPPSRCDLGGKYRTDNVIRSGLIGSLLLCLPNIKDGVIMPVCLSGILAALKNIRSILQGYVNCLRSALQDQKSVGVCERIRSIYICQIVWQEAMTLLGIAGGNLFDFATGKGGGEYLTGLKGGVDNAKETVDYFTNSYATSVFAAYKGRSSKDLGAVICEKAIYGKVPILGEIVEDITKAQNPVQFTAYVEEQALYKATEQKSMYKLYYHIYAGSQNVNYKVYVKKENGRTQSCSECSGTLEPEGFADKSVLFMAEPGYNTVCVDINGKHECNFGRVVSTSFGLNAANNYLLQYQLSKKISTEEECRADMRGILPQAQVEHVCSPLNPALGKGTQVEQEWVKVGTCGQHSQTKASLGECWARLGAVEKTNPEAYRETRVKICENEGGKTCGVGEKCSGRAEEIAVTDYQRVICCYTGNCEKDTKYESLSSELSNKDFMSNPNYQEMYAKGLENCKELNTKDPFDKTSLEWQSFEGKIEENTRSEEYNELQYFKGVMYILCRNCADAKDEFNKIDRKSKYFTEACGENKLDNGGKMRENENCPHTCSGITTTKKEEQPGAESPTPVLKLQLKTLTLKTPDGKPETFDIKENQNEISLKIGGTYKVEKMTFTKPVKSCSFYFGTGELKKVEASEATVCAFTEDNEFSTTGVESEKSYLFISGENKNEEDYAYAQTFDIKILERLAKRNEILLCKAAIKGDTYKFCLNIDGNRCSDYYYKNEPTLRFSHVKTPQEYYAIPLPCKTECEKNYCIPIDQLSNNDIIKS